MTWLVCTLVIVSQKSSGTRFASNNFRKNALKYKQNIFFNLKLFPWNIEEHYMQDVSLIFRSLQNDLTCYPLWCKVYYETSNTLTPSWFEFKTFFDRLNVLLSCRQHQILSERHFSKHKNHKNSFSNGVRLMFKAHHKSLCLLLLLSYVFLIWIWLRNIPHAWHIGPRQQPMMLLNIFCQQPIQIVKSRIQGVQHQTCETAVRAKSQPHHRAIHIPQSRVMSL